MGFYCQTVLDDLSLSSLLPASRYRLIKYEDFLSSPLPILESLYTWSGMNFTDKVTRYIDWRPENIQINAQFYPWVGLGKEATLEQYVKMMMQPTVNIQRYNGKQNNFSALPIEMLKEIESSC